MEQLKNEMQKKTLLDIRFTYILQFQACPATEHCEPREEEEHEDGASFRCEDGDVPVNESFHNSFLGGITDVTKRVLWGF